MRGNSPMISGIWRLSAETPTSEPHVACAITALVYRDPAGVLRGGHRSKEKQKSRTKRGRTCSGRAHGIRPLWPRYSGWRRVETRSATRRSNGLAPAPQSARLAPSFWKVTRSKALLSVAWLVDSPPKTGTFGNNRFDKQLDSFISPLTCPPRDSGRGPFLVSPAWVPGAARWLREPCSSALRRARRATAAGPRFDAANADGKSEEKKLSVWAGSSDAVQSRLTARPTVFADHRVGECKMFEAFRLRTRGPKALSYHTAGVPEQRER